MLYNSQLFVLGFLPLALAGYYACGHRRRARDAFLVGASLVFYGWWDVRFVPLLVSLTLATWLLARTGRFLAGIVLNLVVLGVCKYADFARGAFADLTGTAFSPWHLALPLGISFFVFQKIGYLADLRRGDAAYRAAHAYPLLDFSAFVAFFPALIAGPLTRHDELVPQFRRDPATPAAWENLSRGLVLFTIGLFKKVALADTLAQVADPAFAAAAHAVPSSGLAWAGTLAYTLQIYYDFSGYSDMAIGIALMLGLRLPLNFDAPYAAVSVRDFWRRWHMTLSRFLRDYLYIPLGGNRHGAARQCGNLLLTMTLGGLWHGANWTFVAWGGLHGVGLATNHLAGRAGLRVPRRLGWAATLLFVMAGWVIFRAPDFGTARHMFAGLAALPGRLPLDHEETAALLAGIALALAAPTSQRVALADGRPGPWRSGLWLGLPVAATLAWLVILSGGRLQNAFIYFQF